MLEKRFKNKKKRSANFRVCHASRWKPRFLRCDLGKKKLLEYGRQLKHLFGGHCQQFKNSRHSLLISLLFQVQYVS